MLLWQNLTAYTFSLTNPQPTSSTSLARKNNNLPKLSNTWGLLCLVFQAYGVLTQIEKLQQRVWFWVSSPLEKYPNPSRKIVLNNLDSDLTSTLFYGLYYGFQNRSNYGVLFHTNCISIVLPTGHEYCSCGIQVLHLFWLFFDILCTLGEQKLLLILTAICV